MAIDGDCAAAARGPLMISILTRIDGGTKRIERKLRVPAAATAGLGRGDARTP